MDLIAALLQYRYGATFEELRNEVPGYADGTLSAESVRRSFERDKDELITLGVPIESLGAEGEESFRYVIKNTQFYFPYVALMSERGLQKPRHVDQYGYHALAECQFTDGDMTLLADAAACARALGDPVLAAEAEHAIAKFLLDVPPEALSATPGVAIAGTHAAASPKTLKLLGEALQRRKSVTFSYYGIGRDATEERTVHPYGLTFTRGHWYLHAFDPARDGLRRFRVSRIAAALLNNRAPGTPDYQIPNEFSLAAVATPIPAWQLGDDPTISATVRFMTDNSEVRTARQHGVVSSDDPAVVRFDLRREEPFLLWLLGLAGDAVLLEPPALVTAYSDLCQRTLLNHRRAHA